ncbi:hypothetical protein [Sinomonas humi]|uniref:Uncharacterized protein n=1 Tax=Sinomonas humi TaxID=1338436 RepID=A0A0B2ACR3_9MICC|nr:hypothetical protein [Sinomonas humi]KHL01374.1 hypothetical protein LK10_15910 [Sinomonas humi]
MLRNRADYIAWFLPIGTSEVVVVNWGTRRLSSLGEMGADEVVNFTEFDSPTARLKHVRTLMAGGGNQMFELIGAPA